MLWWHFRHFARGEIIARFRTQVEAGGIRADESPPRLAVLVAGAFQLKRAPPERLADVDPHHPQGYPTLLRGRKELALPAALKHSGPKKEPLRAGIYVQAKIEKGMYSIERSDRPNCGYLFPSRRL